MPSNRIEVTDGMWEQIKNEYITTGISIRGIQKKYGIPFNRVRDKAEKEGWNAEREELNQKINQKSLDLVVDIKANECARAFRIASKVLDKLEEVVDNLDPKEFEVEKRLRSITASIKDLKEIGVFRSELDKAEQEARIKKLQKDAEDEEVDKTITVVFEQDMDNYAE